jgi:hypothetical protein
MPLNRFGPAAQHHQSASKASAATTFTALWLARQQRRVIERQQLPEHDLSKYDTRRSESAHAGALAAVNTEHAAGLRRAWALLQYMLTAGLTADLVRNTRLPTVPSHKCVPLVAVLRALIPVTLAFTLRVVLFFCVLLLYPFQRIHPCDWTPPLGAARSRWETGSTTVVQ